MRTDEANPSDDPRVFGASPAKASAWALAVAVLLLACVVLPAEYGVDPTGFGRITGLAAMGRQKAKAQGDVETMNAPVPAAQGAPVAHSTRASSAFRVDETDVTLPAKGQIEFKALMKEGDAIIYEWDAGAAMLKFDFHGEPAAGPEGAFLSFEKGRESKQAGSLRAPFAGTHGWYWKNESDKPVVIRLRVAGFHSELKKM